MDADRHHFDDLQHAVRHVHALFDRWDRNGALEHTDDPTLLHRAKLALHEWLSNLAQHADFQGHAPDVLVHVNPNGRGIRCVVEDNSAGFDLKPYLREQPGLFESFPERGMGLHIINVCVDRLSYRDLDTGRHRFEFHVTDETKL